MEGFIVDDSAGRDESDDDEDFNESGDEEDEDEDAGLDEDDLDLIAENMGIAVWICMAQKW